MERGRSICGRCADRRGKGRRLCGGASQQQKEEAAQQQAFSQQLMNENQTQFAQQQGILQHLTDVYTPILQAGPSQQGFSPAEVTALNTQAMDSSADAYQNADKALNNQYAAKGGGTEYIPSGAQEEMDAGVAEAAAQQLAGAQDKITQANYAQGLQNFDNASNVLAGASGQLGGTGATASAATDAAKSAYGAAAQNTAQNNAWMGTLGSALGGVASSVTYSKGAGFGLAG